MKTNQNKSVYLVSGSMYFDIFGVFSSNRSFNKELKIWANGILNFAKSEEVKVTVMRRLKVVPVTVPDMTINELSNLKSR